MKLVQNIIFPTLELLKKRNKQRGLTLLLLLLFQSILDILSVTSFIPLAYLLINPSLLTQSKLVVNLLPYSHSISLDQIKLFLPALIAIFFVFKHWTIVFIARYRAQYSFSIAGTLSTEIMKRFLTQPYVSFYEKKIGREIVNIVHNPASFATNIILAISSLIVEVIILIGLAIVLLLIDWYAFIFILLVGMPVVLFYQLIKRRLSEMSANQKVSYPILLEKVVSLFNGFIEINIYQKSNEVIQEVRFLTNELNRMQIHQTTLFTNSLRLPETVAGVALCLLVGFILINQMTVESSILLIGIYSACGLRAIPSFNRIISAVFQLKTNEHVITELLKNESENKLSEHNINQIPFTNSIDLSIESFEYPDRGILFRELQLEIKKGEKIGIIGNSGIGKSTLLLFLMGLLETNSSKLKIDKQLLSGAQLVSWRQILSFVPQAPFFLNGSISKNVSFNYHSIPADRYAILDALDQVGLTDWINQLPNKLETNLGENGMQLSGGQRQRIAIARAIFMKREILLLDEITNNLDEQAVHQLLKMLAALPSTVIMVTHDEGVLSYFDRVFKVEAGRLIEQSLSSKLSI